MNMYESFYDYIPRIRSQYVNYLDIPDVSVRPYIWREPYLHLKSECPVCVDDYEARSISTDTSLALSRAMTDSEIDYDRYRRLRLRSYSDPWLQMRAAQDAFPRGYLDSMYSYMYPTTDTAYDRALERFRYNEELRLKMERFFNEECRVFTPDDPGLLALEDALRTIDLKNIYWDTYLP